MTSIIVVLPAPFGPITQRSSPASIASDSLFSARKPSKLTSMSSRYRIVPCDVSMPAGITRPIDAVPLTASSSSSAGGVNW
jgi:hypothetical protein